MLPLQSLLALPLQVPSPFVRWAALQRAASASMAPAAASLDPAGSAPSGEFQTPVPVKARRPLLMPGVATPAPATGTPEQSAAAAQDAGPAADTSSASDATPGTFSRLAYAAQPTVWSLGSFADSDGTAETVASPPRLAPALGLPLPPASLAGSGALGSPVPQPQMPQMRRSETDIWEGGRSLVKHRRVLETLGEAPPVRTWSWVCIQVFLVQLML